MINGDIYLARDLRHGGFHKKILHGPSNHCHHDSFWVLIFNGGPQAPNANRLTGSRVKTLDGKVPKLQKNDSGDEGIAS